MRRSGIQTAHPLFAFSLFPGVYSLILPPILTLIFFSASLWADDEGLKPATLIPMDSGWVISANDPNFYDPGDNVGYRWTREKSGYRQLSVWSENCGVVSMNSAGFKLILPQPGSYQVYAYILPGKKVAPLTFFSGYTETHFSEGESQRIYKKSWIYMGSLSNDSGAYDLTIDHSSQLPEKTQRLYFSALFFLPETAAALKRAGGTDVDEETGDKANPPHQNFRLLNGPSKEQALKRWEEARPRKAYASAFARAPSTSLPYYEGKLDAAFVKDGLAMLNFVRYLAGLNDAIALADFKMSNSQKAAVVLAAGHQVRHFPNRPADMPEEFFWLGQGGCMRGNLFDKMRSFPEAISGFLFDPVYENLGHRLSLLSPSLKTSGFGYAEKDGVPYGVVTTTITKNYFQFPETGLIAWPPPGVFPVDLLYQKNYRWSLSFDPQKFILPDSPHELRVEYSRSSAKEGKKVQVLDSRINSSYNSQAAYFDCDPQDTKAYHLAFRPAGEAYKIGDTATIRIDGMRDAKSGERVIIIYSVEFIDLPGF